jgi:hypothetical protein
MKFTKTGSRSHKPIYSKVAASACKINPPCLGKINSIELINISCK